MVRFVRAALAALVVLTGSALLAACEVQPASPDAVAQADAAALTGPACAPTGAHVAHGRYACATCHSVPGALCFEAGGAAQAPGAPAPAFDFAAKTCSSVACHGMYSGTYTYSFPGGDGEPESRTVSYAGSGGTTPSWYATGLGCTACHGNPPPGTTWHGFHSAGNQCELCHNHVVSQRVGSTSRFVGVGFSTGTNCGPTRNKPCSAFHGNGVVDVTPAFRTSCFNCH